MQVRAKFRVDSVQQFEHSEIVRLTAVYGGSTNAEDNTFAEATPCAELTMTITNKAVHGQFKPGQKFYADFTPAE